MPYGSGMSLVARIATFVSVVMIASSAWANPPALNAARVRSGTAPTVAPRSAQQRAIEAAPPAPPVALQLTGLRINVPLPRSAVVHAIGRDAWPQLVRCVSPAPRVRGYLTVNIAERDNGTEATFTDSPVLRDRALVQCLQRALSGIVFPPHAAERPASSVAFDLVFMLPPVTVAPRRGAHR